MLAIVVSAAGIVTAGILRVLGLGPRMSAALLVPGLLVVLARVLAVLVAAARPAKASGMLVLVWHGCSGSKAT